MCSGNNGRSNASFTVPSSRKWGQGVCPRPGLIRDINQVDDNPSDEPTAKKALKAIAEARQSYQLLTFLESGMPLDVNAAYATLGIEDQTVADDNLLINIFNISVRISSAFSLSRLTEVKQSYRTPRAGSWISGPR